jgi:hypothetical protein
MTTESNNAVESQRKYYADTAAQYEAMHGTEGSADPLHMDFVIAILRIRTVLDVGAASGRTLRTFRTALPDLFACGIESVGPF